MVLRRRRANHPTLLGPEVLLDGDHSIDRTLEMAEKVWAEDFFYLEKCYGGHQFEMGAN